MQVNWVALAPELITIGLAVLVLALDMAWPAARAGGGPALAASRACGCGSSQARFLGHLSWVGLAFGAVAAVGMGPLASGLEPFLIVDSLAVVFKLVVLVSAAIVCLASVDEAPRYITQVGAYYALLLLSTLGLLLLVSAGDLLTLYLALELSTISLYALTGYMSPTRLSPDSAKAASGGRYGDGARRERQSAEAGLKYLILGAVASGVLLYGASLIFGAYGTTEFDALQRSLRHASPGLGPATVLGLVLVSSGLAFKVAASPFHMWAPDVYQGAPTPVTAFLSVGSKGAGFAVLIRFLMGPFFSAHPQWAAVIALFSLLSMLIGNLIAIPQTNIKRMLAYSGIAHAGYMLVGVAAANELGVGTAAFYALQYAFTNAGAFIVVGAVAAAVGGEEIRQYAGLSQRKPALALAMLLLLLSLGGIPPLAGFWAKLYIFAAGIQAGLWWLVLVGALMSVVALYYYLMVVKQMYIVPPVDDSPVTLSWSSGAAIVVATIVVVAMAYPSPFLSFCMQAAQSVLMR
jgi:NADH-quinone oxidoreductase subunit N